MTRRATSADQTRSTTCNWYTGGAIMETTCGSGTGRQRLEPDDGQPSCPVLRGRASGNGARLPDICCATPAMRCAACSITIIVTSMKPAQIAAAAVTAEPAANDNAP